MFFPFPVWWDMLVPGSGSFFGDMKISLSFYRVSMSMVRQLLENCPELNLMLHDPEVMKQVGSPKTDGLQKPEKIQQILDLKKPHRIQAHFSRVIGKKTKQQNQQAKKHTMMLPPKITKKATKSTKSTKIDAPPQKKTSDFCEPGHGSAPESCSCPQKMPREGTRKSRSGSVVVGETRLIHVEDSPVLRVFPCIYIYIIYVVCNRCII